MKKIPLKPLITLLLCLILSACFSQTSNRGHVLPQEALEQISEGSSKDQVLIVYGTPSTTSTNGQDAFYYISQKTKKSFAFAKDKVVEQRVVAVYFDEEERVKRVANYGLKDGQVFDFVSRTTPTSGLELSFVGQLLQGVGRPSF